MNLTNISRMRSSSRAIFYKRATWEKLIRRWAQVARSPESDLLAAVIAQAIEDRANSDMESGLPVTFGPSFMKNALPSYCTCLGIDPQFLIEQCNKAFAEAAA